MHSAGVHSNESHQKTINSVDSGWVKSQGETRVSTILRIDMDLDEWEMNQYESQNNRYEMKDKWE